MRIKYLLATVALTLVAGVTFAGLVSPVEVTVTLDGDGSGAANGNQWTARSADNDVEFIGCGIRVINDGAGGTFSFGFCQAGDSDGVEAFCSTLNADVLDAMKASSDFAFITFGFDAAGECQRIGFSTQSFYLPDFKTNDADSDSDSDSDSD